MALTGEHKVLIGVLVVTVLIIIGGAFLAGQDANAPTASEPVSNPDRLVREDDPVLGPEDAQVTVVEFGDFECPACGALHPPLKQVKADNADASVRFVYRQFPLEQHDHAQLSAEASLEAQAQGKFWEYHDLLFENQNSLTREDLESYAEQLELDMDSFRAALDDGRHADAVEEDKVDGRAVGVRGTPSLYINGVSYTGQYSVAALQAAIDQALTQ